MKDTKEKAIKSNEQKYLTIFFWQHHELNKKKNHVINDLLFSKRDSENNFCSHLIALSLSGIHKWESFCLLCLWCWHQNDWRIAEEEASSKTETDIGRSFGSE